MLKRIKLLWAEDLFIWILAVMLIPLWYLLFLFVKVLIIIAKFRSKISLIFPSIMYGNYINDRFKYGQHRCKFCNRRLSALFYFLEDYASIEHSTEFFCSKQCGEEWKELLPS